MRTAGAARPAPSPLEERTQRGVDLVGALVVRQITCLLYEHPLEIVLVHAERVRVLHGVVSREIAPQQQRGLTDATQRDADVDVETSTQQRTNGVLATGLSRHAHVVL